MDADRAEHFRQKLLERKRDLLAAASDTIGGALARNEDNLTDFADLAYSESERNFQLRIRDRERKLIAKIDAALKRIEEGIFGICDECGEEIGEKRLEARPVTTLCISCKTEQERTEVD